MKDWLQWFINNGEKRIHGYFRRTSKGGGFGSVSENRSIQSFSIEEMYQAFKARLEAESADNPHIE